MATIGIDHSWASNAFDCADSLCRKYADECGYYYNNEYGCMAVSYPEVGGNMGAYEMWKPSVDIAHDLLNIAKPHERWEYKR